MQTEYHETHMKYTFEELKNCMRDMIDSIVNPNPKEKAVRKKYSKEDRFAVSMISVRD